jgi:hypothetical protein
MYRKFWAAFFLSKDYVLIMTKGGWATILTNSSLIHLVTLDGIENCRTSGSEIVTGSSLCGYAGLWTAAFYMYVLN